MDTIQLHEGTQIPIIGFGTYKLVGETCKNAVKIALEEGYTHIDTAFRYGNHKEIAAVIKNVSRESLFITTKLWMDQFDDPKKWVLKALEELELQYVDLVLLHWPDRSKDMNGAFRTLLELKEEGVIRNVGVSNFTIHHLQDMLNVGLKPAVNQVEFHPLLNQDALLRFCQKQSIALTAYSPLAHGELIGNKDLLEIGAKYGKSECQVALRWLMQKGIVTIPKSSRRNHIKSNFEIFDFELSQEDMESIERLNQDKRVIDPSFGDFDY